MGFVLGSKSRNNLVGVHPDLVRVVERAIQVTREDFMVSEGVRTLERQRELWAKGRTKPGPKVTWTMRSKHLTGHAVDLVPWPPLPNGKIDWNNVDRFVRIGLAMHQAANELGVKIRWGYDWDGDGNLRERGEYDGPHFELA